MGSGYYTGLTVTKNEVEMARLKACQYPKPTLCILNIYT